MTHSQTVDCFFAMLRYAIGTDGSVPPMSLADLKRVYGMAAKQSLMGVLYVALERGNVRPTDIQEHQDEFKDLLMEWMGEKVKIERGNKKVSQDAAAVSAWMLQNGFETCLLKGQGNALLYPNPSLRTPGDIDLWTRLKRPACIEESVCEVIAFARKNGQKDPRAVYHHVTGLEWNDTEIELHYRPQFLQSFAHNARLQQFFLDNADGQFHHFVRMGDGQVAVPVPAFNIVFQLSHIFVHLFQEGIGLRQILDYYYVLKSYAEEGGKDSTDWNALLNYLGLFNIAGAIMWILEEKLGMNCDWSIVSADEKRGRFVLNEILQGGTFGKYDERNARFGHTKFGRNVQRLVRDLRLVRYFPSEALSEPFFRLWHAWWRRKHN